MGLLKFIDYIEEAIVSKEKGEEFEYDNSMAHALNIYDRLTEEDRYVLEVLLGDVRREIFVDGKIVYHPKLKEIILCINDFQQPQNQDDTKME